MDTTIAVETDQSYISSIPLFSPDKCAHLGDSIYSWNGNKLVWRRYADKWSSGVTMAMFATHLPPGEVGLLVVGCKDLSSVSVNGVRGMVVTDENGRKRLQW